MISKDLINWKALSIELSGSDNSIRKNQIPKKLPLAPRAETPIKSDKVSIIYRRWLTEKSIGYGAIANSENL